MKRIVLTAVAMMAMGSISVEAQSVTDVLKGLAGQAVSKVAEKSGNSTLGNVVANLLGTTTVSKNSLKGTWSYTQPCIAVESQNILTNIGGTAVTGKLEQKMQTYLDKAGFTAGKVSITFGDNNSATITAMGKKIPCTYSVEGSNLTLKLGSGKLNALTGGKLSSAEKFTTVKLNCKVTGGTLQIATESKKFATLMNDILSKAGSASGSAAISSISSLTSSVQGIYLGLKFERN